jgi:hypothetical protein
MRQRCPSRKVSRSRAPLHQLGEALIRRGTKSSNPASSSAESAANSFGTRELSHRNGLALSKHHEPAQRLRPSPLALAAAVFHSVAPARWPGREPVDPLIHQSHSFAHVTGGHARRGIVIRMRKIISERLNLA